MSSNRNTYTDQQETNAILQSGNQSSQKVQTRPNWLWHTRGCANIDTVLIQGATVEEMENYRGSVKEHIRHLRVEHGLNIVEVNGVFRFSKN